MTNRFVDNHIQFTLEEKMASIPDCGLPVHAEMIEVKQALPDSHPETWKKVCSNNYRFVMHGEARMQWHSSNGYSGMLSSESWRWSEDAQQFVSSWLSGKTA